MTNFDKITQSPEAVAEFILQILPFCNLDRCKKFNDSCEKCVVDWLNQEAEEDAE